MRKTDRTDPTKNNLFVFWTRNYKHIRMRNMKRTALVQVPLECSTTDAEVNK